MNNKLLYGLLFVSTMALTSPSLYAYPDSSHPNTPNNISAPKSDHPLIYTISAEDALLVKDTKNHYHLTLKKVQQNIAYKTNVEHTHKHKANGLQSLSQFITSWQSKNPTGKVGADVSGVQIDNKSIGHTQFYASVLLSNPVYNKQRDELVFDFTPGETPLQVKNYAQFHNPTIFVNGCDLCDCSSKKGNCDIILMSS